MSPHMSEEMARIHRETMLAEAAARRLSAAASRVRAARTRDAAATPARAFGPRRARRAVIARLQALELFRGLSKRDLLTLAGFADPFRAPEGTTLTGECRPRRELVVLMKGAAEATVRGRRVAVLTPGDHVGALAMLGADRYAPTVTAMTPVEGYVLGERAFWDAVHAIPALAARLTRRFADELRRIEERLAEPGAAEAAGDLSVERTVREATPV